MQLIHECYPVRLHGPMYRSRFLLQVNITWYAGFTNMTGFLAPYRSERYHLDQFRGGRRRPNGYKELFNYRH